MHQLVDRSTVKILQTVGVFYVRDGQRTASEILDNAVKNFFENFCKIERSKVLDVHQYDKAGIL